MYCEKCGNKVNNKDKFCGNCGNDLKSINFNQDVVQLNNNQQVVKSTANKKALAVAITIPLLIISLIFILIISIFIFVGSLLSNAQIEEYITMGDDEIPTVYNVIGERDLCSVSNNYRDGMEYKIYTYCNSELSIDDYTEYANYLIEEEDFISYGNSLSVLIKDSVDEGKILIVQFDIYSDTIYYRKEKYSESKYDPTISA